MNRATIYEAEFIVSGPAGYPEDNEVCLIRDSVLINVVPTLVDRPVHLTHKGKTPIGHITEVKKDNEYYKALLSIFDSTAIKNLDSGWGFSSIYIAKDKLESVVLNEIR